jgi:hypothetical protein
MAEMPEMRVETTVLVNDVDDPVFKNANTVLGIALDATTSMKPARDERDGMKGVLHKKETLRRRLGGSPRPARGMCPCRLQYQQPRPTVSVHVSCLHARDVWGTEHQHIGKATPSIVFQEAHCTG